MSNSVKSIAQIFERKLFRVPDYQRGYSWQKKQLDDFWDDIERLQENKIHYSGLLTVREAILEEDDKFGKWKQEKWLIETDWEPYYIVDGQQRLTTIIILIQAILNKINEQEMLLYESKTNITEKYIKRSRGTLKSFIFGYKYNDPSNKFLISNIFKDDTETYTEPMTVYTVNLKKAFSFFTEKLKDYSSTALDFLFKKITLKLQFNLYIIKDELDEFVVFETTNNRGKPLSTLELLKNRLIYLTTIMSNVNNEENGASFEEERKKLRLQINESWRKIYEYLGKNQEKVLDDDEFLKNHFFMYFGYYTTTAAEYDKQLLDVEFTSKKAIEKKLGIREIDEYTKSIGESAKAWFKVNNPNHPSSSLSSEISVWLGKIIRQNYQPFYTCLLALFLLETSDELLLKILKKMERFYFLIFYITNRQGITKRNKFFHKSHSLYFERKSPESLLEDLNEAIDDRISGFDNSLEKFKIVLKDLLKKDKKVGYYAWQGLPYVLYEYEINLQGSEDRKVEWEDNKNTIEHIYPQNPTDECWVNVFKGFNEEERVKLRNSLGNLLMLSRQKNSKQSNNCFSYKKKHEKNGVMEGYINGSHSEIEVSQNEDWDANSIFKRGLKIMEFIENRWDIDFGDEEEKKELLYLSFLKI